MKAMKTGLLATALVVLALGAVACERPEDQRIDMTIDTFPRDTLPRDTTLPPQRY